MAKETFQAVELWSFLDEQEVREGRRQPLALRAKVDNGSWYTVLPKAVADQLGLSITGQVSVRCADGRTDEKAVASALRLRIPGMPGRLITTDVLVEPNRETVLLGCEELERLCLVADHRAGVLRPEPGTENGIVAAVE